MLTSNEILEEYTECLLNPCYAITEYLKTFDKTQQGFVKFDLFPKQIDIIEAYREHRFTMVTKPRQAGVSTTTAAYGAILAIFADRNNPEQILILANKQDMAFEFLDKIKDFINQFPRWVWGDEYYGTPEKEKKSIYSTESKKELKLPNKSRIRAVATSKDALRGFTPTWLILDEAAFIDNGATVFGAALTALGTGGKATLISTPNGMDELYYNTYEQSNKGLNDFFVIEMKWYQDPRYAKDLAWINDENEDDVIEEVRFTKIGDSEATVNSIHEHYESMIQRDYNPTSSWYREMCRGLNNNVKMIAQELDVSFVGSGGNVIDDKYIIKQEKLNVRPPKFILGLGKDIWIWEKPIEGHQYICAVDVARGDGEDSSTIVMLDFTTMTEVMEFQSKLQSDLLGVVVDEYARLYDALVVVDITGGWGVGTINKLMELSTPNIYHSESTNKPLSKATHKSISYTNDGKYPGFNVSAGLRSPIISHLEMMVRTMGVTIRSNRLTSELRTFVFKGGRADHMDGKHDDLLMALAYALWIAENSFKKLIAAKKQSKAILNGWLMRSNEPDEEDNYQGENFIAKKDRKKKITAKKPNFSNVVSRNMQDPTGQYMWLFSGSK